jgi:hypothetical protein
MILIILVIIIKDGSLLRMKISKIKELKKEMNIKKNKFKLLKYEIYPQNVYTFKSMAKCCYLLSFFKSIHSIC